MTSGLGGEKVAHLEGRLAAELSALVRRHGGEPVSVPAVHEQTRPCEGELAEWMECLGAPGAVAVFSTGRGVAALFAEARRCGRGEALAASLRRVVTVCRGPKPVAALAREGIEAGVRAAAPYTTHELLASLEAAGLAGRRVAVLHYGERNVPLVEALAARGAEVAEIMPYAWCLPEDTGPLARLVSDIVDGRVRVVAFTSQAQARHLFQVAATLERASLLREALAGRSIVAAVGPTCADALRALGVPPGVVPEKPKMGPMVAALAAHVRSQRSHQ